MSHLKLTPAVLEEAERLVAGGRTVRDAADAVGVSKTRLSAALAARRRERASEGAEGGADGSGASTGRREAAAGDGALDDIDPSAPPLTIARALFARAAKVPATSPRAGEARQLAKLIASLEREASKEETPEQRAERLRRESGETRLAILRYVEAAEREATAAGRCAHCGAPTRSGGGEAAAE